MYINSKETLNFTVGIEVPEPNSVKESSSKRKDDKPRFDRNDKRPRYDRHPPLKYNNYTPPNTTRTNFLMEIPEKPYVKWPNKLRANPDNRDKSKYYSFHRGYDYNMESC